MRNSVIHVIELIIGALLLGLGLIYLMSQQRALTRLTDAISIQIIEDKKIYKQYSITDANQISDEDVYATIMGYREYPIMVDDNVVPLNGHDCELYFTYLKDGFYKKEYHYETGRHISMIIFTHIGA